MPSAAVGASRPASPSAPPRVTPSSTAALPRSSPSSASPLTLARSTLAWSATFACSVDTAWTDALLDAAAGSDLFICEAYTYERPVRYHLSYAALRAHREQLGCRRLLLTHPSPDLLEHRADLADELADDGLI